VPLLFCFFELNLSLIQLQCNALLVGGCLLALDQLNRGRPALCGFGLAAVSIVKPFFLLLLVPLLATRERPRALTILAGAAAGLAVMVLVPTLYLGLDRSVALHVRWLTVLSGDLTRVEPGLLGIVAFLSTIQASWLAAPAWLLVAGLSTVLLVLPLRRQKGSDGLTPTWISLGLTSCLLLNPRTESSALVILAPAYLLLVPDLFRRTRSRWSFAAAYAIFLLSGALLTLNLALFSRWIVGDPSPALISPARSLGLIGLWSLSAWLASFRLRIEWR
jgi:hypothetical protein